MTDHLSALDATFLELEEADESAHMHIGAILTFEPLPRMGTPPLDGLAAAIDGQLDALPRARERLSATHTGTFSWPGWEEAPGFSVERHLRRVALPSPGGDEELLAWAGDFFSHRLDRRRPLWELVLIEGLPEDRWALGLKVHHCLVDGVGSLVTATDLLDRASAAGPPIAASSSGESGGLGSAIVHGVRTGLTAALHPRRAVERSVALAEMLVRNELMAAPRTSINVPLGTRRRFDAVRVPLARLKAVKERLGGTVNDAILALSTGGLRRLLLARGEEPPAGGLRAMVPVNVRGAAEQVTMGNHISSLFVPLPVGEPDAHRRHAEIVRATGARKRGSQAAGGELLLELAALAPPVLHAVIARSLFGTRLFNVTVTNVPGPAEPIDVLGARLREAMPLVPLAAEHAVGIAVVSYAGGVVFGLNADEDAVPDLDVLRAGIEASLDELEAPPEPRGRRRAGGSARDAREETAA
jgi:diacylglycerol O-acyltransferase / wax synthase